jgi:hypothetical protein
VEVKETLKDGVFWDVTPVPALCCRFLALDVVLRKV